MTKNANGQFIRINSDREESKSRRVEDSHRHQLDINGQRPSAGSLSNMSKDQLKEIEFQNITNSLLTKEERKVINDLTQTSAKLSVQLLCVVKNMESKTIDLLIYQEGQQLGMGRSAILKKNTKMPPPYVLSKTTGSQTPMWVDDPCVLPVRKYKELAQNFSYKKVEVELVDTKKFGKSPLLTLIGEDNNRRPEDTKTVFLKLSINIFNIKLSRLKIRIKPF